MQPSNLPRVAKRRSPTACASCRSRKVRCDVFIKGPPCTNCRLDDVACQVTSDLRRHRLRQLTRQQQQEQEEQEGENEHQQQQEQLDRDGQSQASTEHRQSPLPPLAPRPQLQPHPGQLRKATSPAEAEASSLGADEPAATPQFPTFTNIEGLRDSPQPGDFTSPLDSGSQRGLHDEPNYETAPPIQRRRSVHSHARTSSLRYSSSQASLRERSMPEISLPNFIQPIPSHLSPDDVEYLQLKGAFVVPEEGLRRELIRCYVQFVHTFLPIVDLHEFITAVKDNGSNFRNTLSLLLFQAVMFAAIPYINPRHLAIHGYLNRRAMRRVFFTRVKLLCNLDYEKNRLTLVQSTLLLTYWYENPKDPKDSHYWLAVAVAEARALGLDHTPSSSSSPSSSLSPNGCPPDNHGQRRLWKRIWWSCYIRDRLGSMSHRTSPHIHTESFDVPMLVLSDLDLDPLPDDLDPFHRSSPAVKNPSVRDSLARLTLALITLCKHIGQIAELQWGFKNNTSAQRDSSRSNLHEKAAIILGLIWELRQWHDEHHSDLGYYALCTPAERRHAEDEDGDRAEEGATAEWKVVELHRALLKGVYETALCNLARAQLIERRHERIPEPEFQTLARRKVQDAVGSITTVFMHLDNRGLVPYLPNTAVTCIVAASISHLLEMKHGEEQGRREDSAAKLKFCVHVLEQLGEVYALAEFAFRFLRAAAAKKTPARLSSSLSSLSVHSLPYPTSATASRRYDAMPIVTDSCGQQLYDPAATPSILGVPGDDIHATTQSDASLAQFSYPRPNATPNFLASPVQTSGVHLNGNGSIGGMVPLQPRDATTTTTETWSFGLDPAIEAESRADFFAIANGLGIDIDAQLLEMAGCNSILDGL